MHRKMLALIFIFFGISFFSLAQESEWYLEKTIAKIEFSGLKNLKKSDLNGIISSYIGQPFSDDLFNEILDRLYALDYFDEINPYAKHNSEKNDDVLLVFEVIERPVIKSVTFTGNKKIRNGELREQIKIKASDVYVESKVLLDERIIRNYYLKKGYTSSSVYHEVVEKDNGVEVVFHINEGASTIINEIKITGNTIVSERALKKKLELKEAGLFKQGAYQSSTLEMDKQKIISYYKEKGYADATILDVLIESTYNEEKQRNELSLTFVIQEGVQYTFGGLSIKGNEVFSVNELLKQQKLKAGSVYNEVKFQEDLSAIQSVYFENGYMSNEYYPMPVKNTELHEISYALTIVEHARSHIENIIIKGNTKTKEFVIKREIPIEEGDVFSRDKVLNGMRNLMNLQYFSNIIPEPQQGTEENLVDLIWTVEEQSTSNIQFGLTFTPVTEEAKLPISLFCKIENSNLFGEGKTVSGSTTISNTDQSIDFSYSQNWIGNQPIGFSQSISFSHSETSTPMNFWTPNLSLHQTGYYMGYNSWNASFSSAIYRRWTPNFAILSLTAGLTNSFTNNVYDETLYVPVDTGIASYANRFGLSNSIFTSFSIDNRDVNYDPTKGWFASQKIAWYGLIPGLETEFFFRTESKLEGYYKLFEIPFSETYSLKMVLAGYTGLSAIFPLNGTVSDSNKLYVDGMFNGRGWSDYYRVAKGQAMLSNKLELRVPIVPNIIGINGFFDAVAVKKSFSELQNLKIEDFYFSYGPGVRVLMPQMPLHFLFAWRFRVVDGAPKFDKTPFQFVLSFNVVNR